MEMMTEFEMIQSIYFWCAAVTIWDLLIIIVLGVMLYYIYKIKKIAEKVYEAYQNQLKNDKNILFCSCTSKGEKNEDRKNE